MQKIRAIGFDLFNTLITLEEKALQDAIQRLISSLKQNSINVGYEDFIKAYHEAVLRFLDQSRADGKEGHNRFWICEALTELGYTLKPDSTTIASAVDAYFSVFVKHAKLIPGTLDMLTTIKKKYRLGLLSNFTHPPIARDIIVSLGLEPFFEVILISGDLGYRKPHVSVFKELISQLNVDKNFLAYVGDDQEADVNGAQNAGLIPIWTTYVREENSNSASRVFTHYNDDDVHLDVAKISNWQELLTILNGKK